MGLASPQKAAIYLLSALSASYLLGAWSAERQASSPAIPTNYPAIPTNPLVSSTVVERSYTSVVKIPPAGRDDSEWELDNREEDRNDREDRRDDRKVGSG